MAGGGQAGDVGEAKTGINVFSGPAAMDAPEAKVRWNSCCCDRGPPALLPSESRDTSDQRDTRAPRGHIGGRRAAEVRCKIFVKGVFWYRRPNVASSAGSGTTARAEPSCASHHSAKGRLRRDGAQPEDEQGSKSRPGPRVARSAGHLSEGLLD